MERRQGRSPLTRSTRLPTSRAAFQRPAGHWHYPTVTPSGMDCRSPRMWATRKLTGGALHPAPRCERHSAGALLHQGRTMHSGTAFGVGVAEIIIEGPTSITLPDTWTNTISSASTTSTVWPARYRLAATSRCGCCRSRARRCGGLRRLEPTSRTGITSSGASGRSTILLVHSQRLRPGDGHDGGEQPYEPGWADGLGNVLHANRG